MGPQSSSEGQLHCRGARGPSGPAGSSLRTPQRQGTVGAGGAGTPPLAFPPGFLLGPPEGCESGLPFPPVTAVNLQAFLYFAGRGGKRGVCA